MASRWRNLQFSGEVQIGKYRSKEDALKGKNICALFFMIIK